MFSFFPLMFLVNFILLYLFYDNINQLEIAPLKALFNQNTIYILIWRQLTVLL